MHPSRRTPTFRRHRGISGENAIHRTDTNRAQCQYAGPLMAGNRGHPPALAPPRTVVRVTHGANEGFFPVAGKSVASVRKALVTPFGIPPDALPMIGGRVVGPDHILAAGDELLFAKEKGHKGVGSQVWTDEEFCKFFKITREDPDAWIAQGLKVGHP